MNSCFFKCFTRIILTNILSLVFLHFPNYCTRISKTTVGTRFSREVKNYFGVLFLRKGLFSKHTMLAERTDKGQMLVFFISLPCAQLEKIMELGNVSFQTCTMSLKVRKFSRKLIRLIHLSLYLKS